MKFTTQSTDEELIHGCRRNDRVAQKCLYERFYGRMMGIAMRYTANEDEAVDILNAAFLKVFSGLDKYESQGNLAGWIARVVFNAAIDQVRRNTRYRKMTVFDALPVERPVNSQALDGLQMEDLYRLIQKLPPASRSVFCLYALDGYKHQEIGTLLGISEGTSKWHLSEARRELQRLIRAQQIIESSSHSA